MFLGDIQTQCISQGLLAFGGGTTPLNVEKFVKKKTDKGISMIIQIILSTNIYRVLVIIYNSLIMGALVNEA